MDVIARKRRAQGYNVLYPIGWDAFGLPTENYAIKTGQDPRVVTKKNSDTFRKQIQSIGISFDWSREINTTDPAYYKWTQWIFLQFFKKGLAYKKKMTINWCPKDLIGLANEEVIDGKCERCGTPVEKREKEQWMLAITKYADRLLNSLNARVTPKGDILEGTDDVPCFTQTTEPGAVRHELPFVERKAIVAIVKHWSEDKYIGLKWKKVDWQTLITGGVEGKQTPEEAAIAEIVEETGYKNPAFIRALGKVDAKFFHVPKNVNRYAHFDALYFELQNGDRNEITAEEQANHEVVWLSKEEMTAFVSPDSQRYVWAKFLNPAITAESFGKPLLDWKDAIKEQQRNWIGKSEGAELEFSIKSDVQKRRVLIGTRNEAKIMMVKTCLKDVSQLELISLNDLPPLDDSDLVEGNDHLANARLKSEYYFKKTGIPTISTDHVFWVEKWPTDGGVIHHIRKLANPKSGRATDEEVIEYTLKFLKGVGGASKAKFIYGLAFTDEKGTISAEQSPYEYYLQTERSEKSQPGYPMESLLKYVETGQFKVEQDESLRYKKTEELLKDTFVPRMVGSRRIKVFTTRPDTLFGVTYVVLAPEHTLVKELLSVVENKSEVELYIAKVKKESEMERTDATKEKTGVELKGVKAINPAKKEEVPVWIADYVLADYGKGAVMAVPAHDERDGMFAKKYGLPVREVVAPLINVTQGDFASRPGVKTVARECILAIVKHWEKDEFLCLKAPKHGWTTFVIGGIDPGEDPVEAAKREIIEETGFTDFVLVKKLGGHVYAKHFAPHKNENRSAMLDGYYFELKSGAQQPVAEHESNHQQISWVARKDIPTALYPKITDWAFWQRFVSPDASFVGDGILENSGSFSGKESSLVKKEITESVGGKWITTFKLRDWIFSRQRYWGEPIPVVNCQKCGLVPVPEKDLPIKLPSVKNYKPTETGESPLAAITAWVNTKCPQCKGPAQRETDTMPNWAGSSWYYLRYVDPKNKKVFADKKNLDYWTPVDWYNGGMEHTTLHLLYSRFWHKFLFDLGLVPTDEPYTKRTSHGLILAEGGVKMSKSKGNVINPDSIVATVGADSLRLYEMFMGPFDQPIAWDTNNIAGVRRFIERVWKLREKVVAQTDEKVGDVILVNKIIHKAIKKVSDDIEAMRFNTAISTLMITVNELEKVQVIDCEQYGVLLQLLAPFAPHVTEELWASLGNKKSINCAPWPVYDATLAADDEVTIIVQINGKMRGSFTVPTDSSQEELENRAKAIPEALKWIEGKEVKKIIVVPNKLVNIVVV
jgi:leucyl-tRNA synthetase